MENILKILLCVALALPMTYCSENHQNIPIEELEAKLATLDEDGIEKTIFEAGTNVTLGVKLVNQSNEDIEAGGYFEYCDIYTIEEFLLVYKWMKKSENEEASWVPFGKAYVLPIYR